MSTLEFYAQKVVRYIQSHSSPERTISTKEAVRKVLNVSFTRIQRNKLFQMIKQMLQSVEKVSIDAKKNQHRAERSLGEDF
jgi:hypothetical protein